MNQNFYWEQFMTTGKVEDYLTFKAKKDTAQGKSLGGDTGNAGNSKRDRDGAAGGTYRGI